MHKSKNRYFYHIFVSPGAITLNVVWLEREFDAYKLFCCMCPSITVSEIEQDICENVVILSYPLHSTPPLGGFLLEYRHPVWYGKTRMVGLPDGEKKLRISITV